LRRPQLLPAAEASSSSSSSSSSLYLKTGVGVRVQAAAADDRMGVRSNWAGLGYWARSQCGGTRPHIAVPLCGACGPHCGIISAHFVNALRFFRAQCVNAVRCFRAHCAVKKTALRTALPHCALRTARSAAALRSDRRAVRRDRRRRPHCSPP
jgi:hypothetical protein